MNKVSMSTNVILPRTMRLWLLSILFLILSTPFFPHQLLGTIYLCKRQNDLLVSHREDSPSNLVQKAHQQHPLKTFARSSSAFFKARGKNRAISLSAIGSISMFCYQFEGSSNTASA